MKQILQTLKKITGFSYEVVNLEAGVLKLEAPVTKQIKQHYSELPSPFEYMDKDTAVVKIDSSHRYIHNIVGNITSFLDWEHRQQLLEILTKSHAEVCDDTCAQCGTPIIYEHQQSGAYCSQTCFDRSQESWCPNECGECYTCRS